MTCSSNMIYSFEQNTRFVDLAHFINITILSPIISYWFIPKIKPIVDVILSALLYQKFNIYLGANNFLYRLFVD